MAHYRIFLFKGGHIERALSVEADDDGAAFNLASAATGGEPFEIWEGARMVVSVGAPLPDIAVGTG
jgi:hypothetical protein